MMKEAKMKKYKTIGILGGMGPAATADLYDRIISIFQKKFNAKYDKDFPEIAIISLPIPDIVEDLENEKLTLEMLIDAATRLELVGCDFIAIPCNSAHVYIDEIRKSVKINVISIIEEVAKFCKSQNMANVGLLATEFTRMNRLYDNAICQLDMSIINLGDEQQLILTKLIISILSGEINQSNKDKLWSLINYLKDRKADAIILGCTELPLLIGREYYYIQLIDTTHILAESCVRAATKVI